MAVRENMEYVFGATGVHSTGLDAWQERKGVCQDFAHVSLAMLRSLGLPARYVGGSDARATVMLGGALCRPGRRRQRARRDSRPAGGAPTRRFSHAVRVSSTAGAIVSSIDAYSFGRPVTQVWNR